MRERGGETMSISEMVLMHISHIWDFSYCRRLHISHI